MSLAPADVLPLVQRLYPAPLWLAPALVALAQVEAGTHDRRINVYARGDEGRSLGAWQVHSLDWPVIAAGVEISYALPSELASLEQQAKLIRPIVLDALREIARVPTWNADDQAAALQAVWQLGAPGFRRVVDAAGRASWLTPVGPLNAIAALYGQSLAALARSRAERYAEYLRDLAGAAFGAWQFGGEVFLLGLLIAGSLALGTEKGRKVTWQTGKAAAAAATRNPALLL